jgi:hypothetical protein
MTYVELKSWTLPAFSGLIPIGMITGGVCFSLLDISLFPAAFGDELIRQRVGLFDQLELDDVWNFEMFGG